MTYRIAIVGAGPAGCYTAQALRKQLEDAEITVIERLPVPYGLVRYGVAGDHQGTKAVTRQFARVFERQNVEFLGNVEVGRDVELSDIRETMDAVVLATGLYNDRPLGIDGERLAGVYGAGALTRYWNGHPDDSGLAPELGRCVAVIGNGNVAMDIVRLLGKGPADFSGSDIDPDYFPHAVEKIHVVGRSDIAEAKFDVAMVKELAGITNLRCSMASGDALDGNATGIAAALAEVFAVASAGAQRQVIFHSGWASNHIEAENDRVAVLHLTRQNPRTIKTLACDSIVTAIGFDSAGECDRAALSSKTQSGGCGPNDNGLFAVGWLRRGPQGTIPENRADAQNVAAQVAKSLRLTKCGTRPGRAALIEKLSQRPTTYSDWLAIDRKEIAMAAENRCRRKIRTTTEMLNIVSKNQEDIA